MIDTVLASVEFDTLELADEGVWVFLDETWENEQGEATNIRVGVQCGASVLYLSMTTGQATDLMEGIAETLSRSGF